MKALPLLLFALVYCTGSFAQRPTRVTVKAGNNIMDVLSMADVFYYPQFTNGRIFFRSGTSTEAKLNYNRLVDEMHFISSTGDTLAIADEMNIRLAVIGNDSFYYDKGYLRLISSRSNVKLTQKQIWIVADTKQIGAYGSTNNTVSIISLTSLNEGGRLYDLTVNEDVVLSKKEEYFLGDKYNHFVPASKKHLLLLFPNEKARIEAYIKENKTDFTKKEDLEKIVQFLEHL